MLYDGCFYIGTEVNRDKAAATLRQIMAELKKLREDTRWTNRNWVWCAITCLVLLLNGLDGPLNASEMVRNILAVEGLPWAEF